MKCRLRFAKTELLFKVDIIQKGTKIIRFYIQACFQAKTSMKRAFGQELKAESVFFTFII